MAVTQRDSIVQSLRSWTERFDAVLSSWLPGAKDGESSLVEAMRYSALAPGKRLRPYVAVRCCELAGGRMEDAYPGAVAVECVHAFSLIHDDLPAMDDDALRRGRPTNHAVYGEALAILAGDALLNHAYQILSTRIADPAVAVASAQALSMATGVDGMIGGQARDMAGEHAEPTEGLVAYIQLRKTARLFEAASRLGAIAAGAPREVEDQLGQFGRGFGLAFQIADDLLDVTGTPDAAGKAVGKDAASGKQTYPSLLGIEGARRAAHRQAQEAVDHLADWGERADDLRNLVWAALDRAALGEQGD